MPRQQRIEYENTFYHVMNCGRARQAIFLDERYYQAFLDTLAEAYQRFHCIIESLSFVAGNSQCQSKPHHAAYQRCLY